MSDTKLTESTAAPRRAWTTPAVTAVGAMGDLLRSGSVKSTTLPGDPGETLKQAAQG